jgi:hypothetical protein
MQKARVDDVDGRIELRFGYNQTLLEDIKAMSGARWNPDGKFWHIDDNEHNRFQLSYLKGEKPYAPYDAPLVDYTPKRKLFTHQVEMVRHALTRHYCIFACEMGTGKTLASIETMETSGITDWWYVAPKSALASVYLEMLKWGSTIRPKFLTYEALVRAMREWSKWYACSARCDL